ncbi:hypothetical protein BESB_064490 [Besnoitia besnoiti]|uniref:Transmembrane protein n=1 Tax=Besnoitia besnoiti TaxID=94643 RepID=A0A2A9M7G1_BESBE|nr:hypothetical protein BESB_064490 [Besnoitia besnoiti]PFH34418.1 hypothetical protein BESB_064490 [Besnoitia besnoiti]
MKDTLVLFIAFHVVNCGKALANDDAISGENPHDDGIPNFHHLGPTLLGTQGTPFTILPPLWIPGGSDQLAHMPYLFPDSAQGDPAGSSRSTRRAQKQGKRPGTRTLKLAATLALVAAFGTEVANYYDRNNEGVVTDLEYDERMSAATRTIGAARLAALVFAAVGGARYMKDMMKLWWRKRF